MQQERCKNVAEVDGGSPASIGLNGNIVALVDAGSPASKGLNSNIVA